MRVVFICSHDPIHVQEDPLRTRTCVICFLPRILSVASAGFAPGQHRLTAHVSEVRYESLCCQRG